VIAPVPLSAVGVAEQIVTAASNAAPSMVVIKVFRTVFPSSHTMISGVSHRHPYSRFMA
jgi:hypothetical protein